MIYEVKEKKSILWSKKVTTGYQEPEVIGESFFYFETFQNEGKIILGVPQGHHMDIYGDI